MEGRRQTPAQQGIWPHTGFNHHIGFVLNRRESGLAGGTLEIGPEHMNRAGIVHGGVYCAMLDAACGAAGLFCPHPGRARRSVTLSLTTQFTGICRSGTLTVTGRVFTAGRRIYTSRAEITDEEGRIVAHASGTFQYAPGSETEEGEPVESITLAPATP